MLPSGCRRLICWIHSAFGLAVAALRIAIRVTGATIVANGLRLTPLRAFRVAGSSRALIALAALPFLAPASGARVTVAAVLLLI